MKLTTATLVSGTERAWHMPFDSLRKLRAFTSRYPLALPPLEAEAGTLDMKMR